MKQPSKQLPPARGFTLIEVLTVIAIIAVLMAAGAIGLDNIKAGKGTSSAIASCESLFEQARTIAVSNRCKARVLIDAESTKDTYLKRIVIVQEELDDNGEPKSPESWILAGRGYTMPSGTFFSQEYSKTEADGAIPNFTLSSGKTEYAGKYFYYEFNGEGIFDAAGSSFVIGAGRPPTGSNLKPKTTSSAARDFAGFVIWRNGRTSTYRSPEQIPNVNTHGATDEF